MTTRVEPPAATELTRTVAIHGIPVLDVTAGEAARLCAEAVLAGRGARVATVNLDFLALARRDRDLHRLLAECPLVIADGMPIVWLAKLAGAKRIQRAAGVDLVRDLFSYNWGRPVRVAIYGSQEEICRAAIPELEALGDYARVVYSEHPAFRELTADEVRASQEGLAAAAPDIVLVALGCPRQERLAAEWHALAPRALWIGIGGTLDFYAGVRKRAPRGVQRFGGEWIVRMAQEPRRLGPRYLLRDIPALAALLPTTALRRITRRPGPALQPPLNGASTE